MQLYFDAPWSRPLTLISLLLAAVLAGMVWTGATAGVWILSAVVALAAVLSVRGYVVEPGALVVRRLGWTSRVEFAGLTSAEADPRAFRRAWRTFGIGGPFAFVGRFRSASVGAFSAYATDRSRAVVLRWPDRAVVVTPDDPDSFATAVQAAAGLS